MLSLKEIQYEEKEMLKCLIKFFDENNFKYYIWAGSLLGAVRHKGFIPWDDDIDLSMTRPEYDKLVKYIEINGNKINNNLQFVGYEIDGSYYPFLKLVNTNIKVTESTNTTKNLWIDIFPLDGIDSNINKSFKIHKKVWHIYMRICAAHYSNLPKRDSFKHFVKHYIYKVLRKIDLNYVISKYIKHCKKYNYEECNTIGNIIWGFFNNPDYITKDMLIDKEYDFEDLRVNGIKDYDTFLKRSYGDYMVLPPIEKRATHNFKAWRINNEN